MLQPAQSTHVHACSGPGSWNSCLCIPAGGDSGIGRAVAVHFAREGADVAIVYLKEHIDADETVKLVQNEGRKCLKVAGDVSKPEACHLPRPCVAVWFPACTCTAGLMRVCTRHKLEHLTPAMPQYPLSHRRQAMWSARSSRSWGALMCS
jgi:hypothetical protein